MVRIARARNIPWPRVMRRFTRRARATGRASLCLTSRWQSPVRSIIPTRSMVTLISHCLARLVPAGDSTSLLMTWWMRIWWMRMDCLISISRIKAKPRLRQLMAIMYLIRIWRFIRILGLMYLRVVSMCPIWIGIYQLLSMAGFVIWRMAVRSWIRRTCRKRRIREAWAWLQPVAQLPRTSTWCV